MPSPSISSNTILPFGQLARSVDSPLARRLYNAASEVWRQGYEQPFLQELGHGTLSQERFTFYMLQDYLYLTDYAKVHALAMTKTTDEDVIAHMVQVQQLIIGERSQVHHTYIEQYGIDAQALAGAKQSAFARAYTSNILAIAYGRPLVDILVAVLPCAWVYADYGTRLACEFSAELPTNPYKTWIDAYAADSFWESSLWLLDHIATLSEYLPEARLAELERIFLVGVEHEYMFWSSAYDLRQSWLPQWDRLEG